jgi:DNA-directed RNA polymerase subunit F
MELTLGTRMAAKDPNRAAQLARDSLKRGYSSMLVELIGRLRYRQPELASQLTKDIAAKLMGERLLKNQDIANLAMGLLRISHSPVRNYQTSLAPGEPPPVKTDSVLLSEQEYRDLFEKAVNDALSFSGALNVYTSERGTAQNILSVLQSMPQELKAYAPDKVAAVEKRNTELSTPTDPQSVRWQKYQEMITNNSIDAALEQVGKAPVDMRDQLYQQVAQKAMNSGDVARARQIVKENISNLSQQRQMLANLESQAIYADASKGKAEDALRAVGNLRTARERANMLAQLVGQIGPGLKRAQVLALLDQARNMLGSSPKVESQEQMSALLEIARAYARYDPKKAFEIVEPLLAQFDEMSNAAQVLNGFGQEFFEAGELQLNNGTSVANFATQLIQSLSSLAPADFDRAREDAERIERPEVRIVAFLGIARQAIGSDDNVQRRSYGVWRE